MTDQRWKWEGRTREGEREAQKDLVKNAPSSVHGEGGRGRNLKGSGEALVLKVDSDEDL